MKAGVPPRAAPRQWRSGTGWKWTLSCVLLLLYAGHRTWNCMGAGPSFADLRKTLLAAPSPKLARQWSAYYTSDTHLAGEGLEQARWTAAKWREFGINNAHIVSHHVRLPRPGGHQRLALLQDGKVLYEAPLVDGPLNSSFVPAYLGFSHNGNLSASYVFCNFGRQEDFDDLASANVPVKGKIGILKLGNASPYLREEGLEIFRGSQIANAERAGLVGVVFYTDPQNDGPVTEAGGYKPFPQGPARPLAGIERGGVGDFDDFERGRSSKLPCLPISTLDAIRILSALNGYGPPAKALGRAWQGGALGFYGVDYSVGPSPENLILNLVNLADTLDTQVHNVIATIPGKFSDEVVIVGNHRDAWGPGAGDPGSGAAALNEVVRSYGVALRSGWRPLRTIMFTGWEGEEFSQVGALLWIRENLEWLRATTVAYLNVVVAAAGTKFHAKASPLLYRALLAATGAVPSPNQTTPSQSVHDAWGGYISTAGGGDGIRFQVLACVSTVDVGFSPEQGEAVFPYHTGFDSFEWMDQVGDPEWKYHVTSARILSLMAAHLSEPAVLDVSVTDYALALERWVDDLWRMNPQPSQVDLTVLTRAVERLHQVSWRFDSYTESLKAVPNTWWKPWRKRGHQQAIREANRVYIAFERQFSYEPGLDGHQDRHHMIFSPAAWHNESPAMLQVIKALDLRDWAAAKEWSYITSVKIGDAAHLLESHMMRVRGEVWLV